MTNKDKNRGIKSNHKTLKIINPYKTSEQNNCLENMQKTLNRWLVYAKKIIFNKVLGVSALLSIGGFIVGNYISQQRYYDELLDKYLNSMEKLLIKDGFHTTYLDKIHEKAFRQKEAQYKYEQVKNLALAVTGNTLRSLSKNDGMCLLGEPLKKVPLCIPWTRKNPERRQLVLNFLQQSKLGFIDPYSGQRPSQPAESFLEGINLSTMSDSKILRQLDKILGKLNLCQNLEKLDLEKIQLDRAILIKANFTQANLTGAKLSNADLRGAVLKQTDLSNANLTKTNLRNAHLENATLNGTTLERANLIDANLKDVNFNQANFRGAVYGCSVTIPNCFSSNINHEIEELKKELNKLELQEFLTKLELQKKLKNELELKNKLEQKAIEVKPGLALSKLPSETHKAFNEVFKDYSLNNKFLKKNCSNLDKTQFALINTDLSGVNLTGAKLVCAVLGKANLTGANLSGADLTEAILTDTNEDNLKDAHPTGANLRGADLTKVILTGANLRGADLTKAILTGANLKDADLTGAILKDAKGAAINQAKLCNTILPSGKKSVCLNKDS